MGAAKNQSVIVDPCHVYIQNAINEGRCRKEELSIRALTIDLKFQARVDPYEPGHMQQLTEILLVQGWLAPIVVFKEILKNGNAIYRVADGFTRTEVCRKSGMRSIIAWVIDGGERETTEFAAMANQQNTTRRREDKDVTKAIEMLLQEEVWKERSDGWIGDHVGASPAKVRMVRKRLNIRDGHQDPRVVLSRDGKRHPYKTKNTKGTVRVNEGEDGRFRATVNGKSITASTRELLNEKLKIHEKSVSLSRTPLSYEIALAWLGKMGFSGSGFIPSRHPGIRGLHRKGIVCNPCDFQAGEKITDVIGQLVAARRFKEPGCRAVVVCYVEDGPKAVIDLYRDEGFEFMSPDELIANLGG